MRWKSYQTVNAVLIFAAALLTAAALLRGAEYDEQYTLFLTAGNTRPVWPSHPFPAGDAVALQTGHGTVVGIADDLRRTDVHPPLYFWAVWLWRRMFGPGLLAARMLSVVCGVATIGLVMAIRSSADPGTPDRDRSRGVGGTGVSPGIHSPGCVQSTGSPRQQQILAMTACIGCYGFVYTNAIARGFGLAGLLLCAGVLLLLNRRQTTAGLCLGAACATNYLAVFVAGGAILAARGWRAIPAALPFIALDAWFFSAQHASRDGQFPPFELSAGIRRIAAYQAAAVLGGVPLYLDGDARTLATAAAGLVAVLLAAAIAWSRPWRDQPVILAAALAPPLGLLTLGIVFDTTPVEVRYFAFGLPFVAILIARTRLAKPLLLLQAASIAGLLLSPRTMQPARAMATAAAYLPAGTIVLVPNGNDGVGIVGSFAIEAPPDLIIRVMRPDGVIPAEPRLALAPMAQDPASQATLASIRAQLSNGLWRRVPFRSNLELYERTVE